MKKLVAVIVSISMLVLQTTPALAQVPVRNGILKGAKQIFAPSVIRSAGVTPNLGKAVEQAALRNMRLPLTQNYAALLGANPVLPPARQILTHANPQERALLLRSDFVALALNQRASPQDIQSATDFYRANLTQALPAQTPTQTAADIAALGILGTQADAKLIEQTALKAVETPAEAVVVPAAVRALLRLGGYKEIENLDDVSYVQPQFWAGVKAYVQAKGLPVELLAARRTTVDISALQQEMAAFGPLAYTAVNPSEEATYLYVNAGKPVETAPAKPAPKPAAPTLDLAQDVALSAVPNVAADLGAVAPQADAAPADVNAAVSAQDAELAALVEQYKPAQFSEKTQQFMAQTQAWIKRLVPSKFQSADETTFSQRAALYLTAFSIGLEIGTPIMASIKSALNLPLSYAILVTVASFSPYLFGSFIANWLKTKVGLKGTINTGLAMTGGSFILGASALGFDGSFTAWDNPLAQYFALLGTLTVASTGCVFIHSAVGPIMTEISHKANDLVRQDRGTYVELSRSIGMMGSFAFPFIATSMLGMDWSAPFVLALPLVAASTLALNVAKLPNTKPHELSTSTILHSPVVNPVGKARKLTQWKNSFLNNGYVRLLHEEPGVGSFISSLFFLNAIEVAFQSGFLFMIPKLTTSESSQYLLGMIQYAVAFLLGRSLAKPFLRWFPNRNISVATLLAAGGGFASLFTTHNAYALTAALFLAELGISTAFTLSFASTAKHPQTQNRVTSLIMSSAIGCAIGPILFTQLADNMIANGIMSEWSATIATLIAIPAALAVGSSLLLRRMENLTVPGLKDGLKAFLSKAKGFFSRRPSAEQNPQTDL